MSSRHPVLILALWWGLAALIVLAGWCALPAERAATVPTATPTRAITVLPTVPLVVTPSPDVFTVPAIPVILDLLPMTPRPRVPTATVTPAPTETPVPPTPEKPAVQKG